MTIRPVVSLLGTRVLRSIIRHHRKYGIFFRVVPMHSFRYHSGDALLAGVAIIVAEWRTLNQGHWDQCTRHVDQTILCDTPAFYPPCDTLAACGCGLTVPIALVARIGYWGSWNGIEQCLALHMGRSDKRERFSKYSQTLHARTTNDESRFCVKRRRLSLENISNKKYCRKENSRKSETMTTFCDLQSTF